MIIEPELMPGYACLDQLLQGLCHHALSVCKKPDVPAGIAEQEDGCEKQDALPPWLPSLYGVENGDIIHCYCLSLGM